MRSKTIVFFLSVFGFQIFVFNGAFAESTFVKRVIDGDTVILQDDTRVRLIGIDAPEIENKNYAHRGEPFGEEAKKILKEWVEGKTVELRAGPEKKDRYDRRLAYLYLEDHSLINRRLIEVGAAKAYRKFPHPFQAEFIRAEADAKNQKLGLWGIDLGPATWWERLLGKQK